ncbi:hypothetical protein ACFTXO_14020 [Streptomyces sp. NPDC057067]|uniref:hypothetical protein n=1 Tax=unclassified Streptomyces TaxID=2593676 RepID=UPI00362B002D
MADDRPIDASGTKGGISEKSASGIPLGGVATTDEVVASVKEISSQIHDFAGVPGRASEPGPGVRECEGEDPATYFQVYHPWNFKPDSASDQDVALSNLKERLSTSGWVLKDSYLDNSPNKNLNLVADNDSKKASVWIVGYSKDDPPSLSIQVVAACYQVPDGQTVDHY